MLKELLGDLYTDEIAKKVEGKEFAVVNDGSYVPRAKLKEATDEAKELKAQLKERDGQLESLKSAATGNEELTKQIEALKEQNKTVQADYEAKLKAQAKDHAIDQAISQAKGKSAKAIKAMLDLEKISLDGQNILGLDDQLKALQESDAYLFDSGQPAGAVGGGSNPPGGGGNNLTDQQEYENALKSGNVSLAIAIKNKMFGLSKG